MLTRVVVVGGGIAGVSTAAALRAGGFDGALTLVDAGELPYDRPPLSKEFLSGEKDLPTIALQPESWYDEQSVRLVNRTTVIALRPGDGTVELSDGSLVPADRVVLATGGRAARPPIPGADSPRVHVLRTAEDAHRLREALVPGATVLVVGAGLIGAEVASTALGLGCDVTLADPACPPLTAALGDEVAAWLHSVHAEHGVKTVDSGVSTLDDCDADVVVLGLGMVPETTLAEAAGLEVDRGIVVDTGQVTSNPATLAVGDPARTRREGVLLPRTEHWEAAQLDGRRAAATILGTPPPAATAPWFWTDRHGLHVEAVGDLHSAATTILRGQLGTPPFAVFGLRERQVVAAVAVNDPLSARAARRLIDRAVDVEPDRLADPATDLRKLLRG
ncbi:MAG TPA: FAD-dependent oxidoreductase [Amycolatopsis sp.]|nr:FAD-dependent oxidoreductase [Amycolatopsis sp.]